MRMVCPRRAFDVSGFGRLSWTADFNDGGFMGKKLFCLTALAVVLVGPAMALAVPVNLRTGANSSAFGYLQVQPDDLGSWAADFTTGGFGPNADQFRPTGAAIQPVAFT